ncbi:MAG TPA: DeoR family transcriptional regulator [Candidatus Paceibacterota bacterium]
MFETKQQKDTNSVLDIKDSIKDRANKLVAAMYLVTNFLDDLDQIKWKLRHKSLDLKVNLTLGVKDAPTPSVWPIETILSDIAEIISLIDIAVLDRRASAMNFSILRQGYVDLQTESENYINGDWYKEAWLPIGSQASLAGARKEVKLPIGSLTSPNKTAKLGQNQRKDATLPIGSVASSSPRREKIVDFIKQHDWSSIKEIAKSITEVSSKTVQRELSELVRMGKLKKTGERRWSRYSSN